MKSALSKKPLNYPEYILLKGFFPEHAVLKLLRGKLLRLYLNILLW